MDKQRRNTIITAAAITLVLITSGAAAVNMLGFDNITAMINPPSASDSSSQSQGSTLTDPLNEKYDWSASEFEISRQGLSIQIKGIELSKEMGDLNLQHFRQYSGAQFDASGNILNDYTYIKVSIVVQNLYDEKAACFLNNELSFGTLEELKVQRSKNVMTWLTSGNAPLAAMTGESEYEKPEETFFIRNFEPGETREFVVGYLINEADLKKENKFFYSINPVMMSLDYGKENLTHPSDNESSSIVTEATDNEIRYLYLNPFLEEGLK